jgi:ribose 1,5-bisphosphokinase PhnN
MLLKNLDQQGHEKLVNGSRGVVIGFRAAYDEVRVSGLSISLSLSALLSLELLNS